MSRPSTSSLLLYCKDVDARDKPGHDGWARTSSGKQEPDGSDRRPYQPPFWYPRGARPRLVHGWRGRGGRDRRSLWLRQEDAIVDPGLDAQARDFLMEDFVRLRADGSMGAVYVTHNLEEAVRLADRIVVLSRRPGRVREVVAIPMTRGERGDIAAREKLISLQSELWSLIREEAIDAEREVQHA